MAQIVQKLSAKSMGWDRGSIFVAIGKVPPVGGRVLLGRIAGNVSGLKPVINGETGELSYGLKGQFRAFPSIEGAEPVNSGVCYLPSGLQAIIEDAYRSASNGGQDKGASVNFTMDLYAIPATNKAGYSFDGDMIAAPTADDPLAKMLEDAAAIKALPAPVKAVDPKAAADAAAAAVAADQAAKAPAPETAKA